MTEMHVGKAGGVVCAELATMAQTAGGVNALYYTPL